MSQEEIQDFPSMMTAGRLGLEQAAQVYGRELSPEEYWWFGVGLAACTLAELGETTYAVGRIQQLLDRAGHKGVKGDWLQRFVEELAQLDAEGLLWPMYQRDPAGNIVQTGAVVQPQFDARAGYFVALAHVGVALAVLREDQEMLGRLTGAIDEMVQSALLPDHEELVTAALQAGDAGETEEA
ncbi:MAG: hypothetical protein K0R39_4735 [Symbiobacteriaceae bacterium]|nr:hypothetical protein [Symbiobacteriaceae bacterium]